MQTLRATQRHLAAAGPSTAVPICGKTVSCRLWQATRHQHVLQQLNAIAVADIASSPARSAPALQRRSMLLGVLLSGPLFEGLDQQARADTLGISTVFVAGSTGNTGRRVVQQLRAAGFNVRAGVRDIRKAQSLGFALDSGIEIIEADVTKDVGTLANAIGDADAVICATGYGGLNPFGVGSVDETGTMRLVDAAKARRVKEFVLLSSLLTNAEAVGQKDNPNYKFLQLFGGVLSHKLAAEKYLRKSGLQYTIVRPGGLSSEPPSAVGQLITSGEDSLFGLDTDPGRAISRDTVCAMSHWYCSHLPALQGSPYTPMGYNSK
eukprot:GHRR01019122.1.p1 GENE.GHRR01019122.1~~GHRR01019122.1.p1  ORF type:complete len:321 (+),score=102.43 GHRR01019122.1:196-1158(+)